MVADEASERNHLGAGVYIVYKKIISRSEMNTIQKRGPVPALDGNRALLLRSGQGLVDPAEVKSAITQKQVVVA
jgi:hypothetical protein